MTEKQLLKIITRIASVPHLQIGIDTEIDSIVGWDSFCWLNLALEVETEGSIGSIVENVEALKTPRDIMRVIVQC